MPWAFLDSYVLAAPDVGSDDADCQRYVQRLLELYELGDGTCADVLVSARTAEVLFDAEAYPLWDKLPLALHAHRTDIMRIMDFFLSRAPRIEETLGVSYLLLDREVCVPDAHLRGRANPFLEHHHQLLALMWVHGRLRKSAVPVLLTSGLGGAGSLEASGEILAIEDPNPAPELLQAPCAYSGRFLASCAAEEVVLSVEPEQILLKEGRVGSAIIAEVSRRLRAIGQGYWPLMKGWRMGPQFEDSVRRTACASTQARARALLKACADTILGDALSKTHALREGLQATKPAIFRDTDGAAAMRRDIDYDYHLHYWQTAHGPELAVAVMHGDYSIPE